jgi:phage tail sheath gpL-like
VAVASGDTVATIETNALAALALQTDLPVTVAADAGTGVDFVAQCKGTIGNQIMLGVCLQAGEHVPAGLTVTVTPMASGATDPSYSGAITAMSEDQYNTVAIGLCSATAVGLFVTELESRWGPMRQIEGQSFAAFYDTRANLTTLGNGFNSFAFTLVGAEKSATLPLPWELAAATAGRSAAQAQVDPSRALTGISYTGYSAAARGAGFTRSQRDILLSDGVSTILAGSDGRALIERLVTTWQTNAQNIPDTSYQDLTTVRLLAALRFSLRARIASRFARFKLMDDGNVVPPGQPIVTPSTIRAECLALFQDWQDLGWVENLAQFKAELLVERDQSDPNRVNIILPPDLVNNLLVTAAQFAFKR